MRIAYINDDHSVSVPYKTWGSKASKRFVDLVCKSVSIEYKVQYMHIKSYDYVIPRRTLRLYIHDPFTLTENN